MGDEFSLGDFIVILKQHFSKMILWGLFGLILMAVYTFFFVIPTYQSTSKIVVNQTQNASQTITNTDIQTNLSLISTYQSIIKEPIILEDVIESTGNELSIGELSSKIIVQTQNDSLVFGIAVMDQNPYQASDLANAIATTFEKKIGDILEVESVTILSEAVPNLNAVSPNITINLTLGILVGIMFGIGHALLAEYMDKRIKDEKIIEILGWTNLGSVLEMSIDEITETRIDKKIRKKAVTPSLTRRRV